MKPNMLYRHEKDIEIAEWRELTFEAADVEAERRMMLRKSWTRGGLASMVKDAVGTNLLPYNHEVSSPYWGKSRYKNHPDTGEVELCARFAGFYRAALNFPGLMYALGKFMPERRGMNSPYVVTDPWRLAHLQGRFLKKSS